MDRLSVVIKKNQKILSEYIQDLAQRYNQALGNKMIYQGVIDTKNNHFQLVKLGWIDDQFIYSVLLHLDINSETGNIWIQQNNTEILLENDLKKFDISKKQLVLGFRPESMRKYSEFAVA
ncbi:MAG: element excision factor XisI family protein [Bacteroidota bacterium]